MILSASHVAMVTNDLAYMLWWHVFFLRLNSYHCIFSFVTQACSQGEEPHSLNKRSTFCPKETPSRNFWLRRVRACNCCHFLAVSTPNYKSRAYKHKQPYLFPCSRSSEDWELQGCQPLSSRNLEIVFACMCFSKLLHYSYRRI